MESILNLVLGLVIGCYGTLVGAGGGFLLVPLFLLLHKMPHEIAVGTSLSVVAANAFSGAIGYVFKRTIDYRAGVTFAIATIPGAIGGAMLTDLLSGPAFMRVFGVFLIGVSIYLFFRKARVDHHFVPRTGRFYVKREHNGKIYSYNEPLGLTLSLGVGAVSSWLGIGGGILHVPLMTEVLRFPVHIAVATSHFILAFTALIGAFFHAKAGHWNMETAIWIGMGAVLGAQIGVRVSPFVKGSALLRYLSLGMLLVGLRLIFV